MSTSTYVDRISQLCTEFKLPPVGAEAVSRFVQAGQGEAQEILLDILGKPRTGGSGASAGCAAPPGCPQGRPGTPLNTNGSRPSCSSSFGSYPKGTSWTGA